MILSVPVDWAKADVLISAQEARASKDSEVLSFITDFLEE